MLTRRKLELERAVRADAVQEETATQMESYHGLLKLMKDGSKKQLKVFVGNQIGRLSAATGGISRQMGTYAATMAATWAEKVTTLRDFQARNKPTLFGFRIASKGLSVVSRFHGGPNLNVMETVDTATSLEPAGSHRSLQGRPHASVQRRSSTLGEVPEQPDSHHSRRRRWGRAARRPRL